MTMSALDNSSLLKEIIHSEGTIPHKKDKKIPALSWKFLAAFFKITQWKPSDEISRCRTFKDSNSRKLMKINHSTTFLRSSNFPKNLFFGKLNHSNSICVATNTITSKFLLFLYFCLFLITYLVEPVPCYMNGKPANSGSPLVRKLKSNKKRFGGFQFQKIF